VLVKHYQSVSQSVCQSVCLSICLSVCLSVCMPICLFVCQYMYVCMSTFCQSVRLPVCVSKSVCLSVCLSVSLSVCLSVHSFICPSSLPSLHLFLPSPPSFLFSSTGFKPLVWTLTQYLCREYNLQIIIECIVSLHSSVQNWQ